MNNIIRLPVLLIILLLQAACGSTGETKKLESLNDAINEYAYALRWKRIDDAVSYHINEEGVRPEIDDSVMKSIRVTGFKIKDRVIDPDQTRATVNGELTYYNDENSTLKTLEYTQHWWYKAEDKQWFLDGDFPDFK